MANKQILCLIPLWNKSKNNPNNIKLKDESGIKKYVLFVVYNSAMWKIKSISGF